MNYLVGDIQGCAGALARLLTKIDFSRSRDHLYVLGDLVNRGPDSLGTLRRLGKACKLPASFDLAELRGYHYHSGVVFDAYCDGASGGASFPVARGGSYDEVGKAFGRARAATGFSIDLRALASASQAKKKNRKP